MTKKKKLTSSEVVAVACADLHFSHTPPVWRSAEPDWYAAMERPLSELKKLHDKYRVPIFCAGDIFERWSCPHELTNWLADRFPIFFFSIPGQHDIPNHNINEMHRSAYTALLKTGTIHSFIKIKAMVHDDYNVTTFPWGTPLDKNPHFLEGGINIAVVHQYVWVDGQHYDPDVKQRTSFPKKHIDKRGLYMGYDVIICGDNHQGFITQVGNTHIINCGTFMKRATDEDTYRPMVGLIYSDGTIKPHYLDTSKDVYLDIAVAKAKEKTSEIDIREMAKELEQLGQTELDYIEALERYFVKHKTPEAVQKIIRRAAVPDLTRR